jgi:hypothetical protein
MTITGGCRCGAVRYMIEAEPLFARHCWCRDCQYIGVRAGTLDEPDLGKPQSTIWTASAPSWACFDPDLPREAKGGPPPSKN